MAQTAVDKAYEQLIKDLSVTERLHLVERIAHDLSLRQDDSPTPERCDWRTLAGIAPDLLEGVDAQEWVSTGRRDADRDRMGRVQDS